MARDARMTDCRSSSEEISESRGAEVKGITAEFRRRESSSVEELRCDIAELPWRFVCLALKIVSLIERLRKSREPGD